MRPKTAPPKTATPKTVRVATGVGRSSEMTEAGARAFLDAADRDEGELMALARKRREEQAREHARRARRRLSW